MKIILASASPRRKELLSRILSSFEILPANIDEERFSLQEISYQKAKIIGDQHPKDLVLSADTVVLYQHKILGKPKDEKEAISMLQTLSSQKHEVSTFYTIYWKKKNIIRTRQVISFVYFNPLSEQMILDYVATKSPLDKAGAYGIQDKQFPLIAKIEGDEENIMGLPIKEIKEDFISLGIPLKEE